MAMLNLGVLDNMSRSTMRELEKFIKAYNKYSELSGDKLRHAIAGAYGGMLSLDEYNRLLKMAKTLTRENQVPDAKLWNKAKQIFKISGNEKIEKAKEKAALAREKRAKIASIKKEKENTSVYRAEQELEKAQKKVKLSKGAKIGLSIALGLVGAVALPLLLSNFVAMPAVAVVLGAMVGGSIGAMGGASLGQKIENGEIDKLNKHRSLFDENDILISELESEAAEIEREIDGLEDQYEVNIKKAVASESELDKTFVPKSVEHHIEENFVANEVEKQAEVKEPEPEKEEMPKTKEVKAKNMTAEDILDMAAGLADIKEDPELDKMIDEAIALSGPTPKETITEAELDAKKKEEKEGPKKGPEKLEEPKKEKELKKVEDEVTIEEISKAHRNAAANESIGKEKQLNSGRKLPNKTKPKTYYLSEDQYQDITDKKEENYTAVIPITKEALAKISNQLKEERLLESGQTPEEIEANQKYIDSKSLTPINTNGHERV